ncbi:hypothetical protein [Halobellus litoreus]|uniref:hypothetical protein n=1 Tax=Halobellus litoreus TaxID=755310 RepID=UPI00210B0A22|nr:hypothetical protein [Halobellus litoreus]
MAGTLTQNIALSRARDEHGYVDASVVFEIPSNVGRVSVQVPPWTTVDSVRGFDRRSGSQQFVWTGGASRPTLELTVPAEKPTLGAAGTTMVDVGEWAIIEAPNLLTQWRHRGEEPTFERRLVVDDEGIASSDGGLVYLGPHREHTRRAAGQRIRLVEPRAASLRESPRDILDALAHAARELRVSGRDEEVVGIAAPTRPVNWGPGGLHAGGNAFWARDSSRLDKPNSTWIHEYVHTRQEFGTDASMKWIVEATAVYYATQLTYERGGISDGQCHAALNTSTCATDALGTPVSWSSAHVPYRKGSRVVSWLDRQIREYSTATLADVLASMNRLSDGSITDPPMLSGALDDDDEAVGFEDFKRLVAAAVGSEPGGRTFRPIESGLDSAVTSSSVPEATSPPGVGDVSGEPVADPAAATDATELLDDAFGERYGEEVVEGDGRIDEGTVFGDDGDGGSLIEESDIFGGDRDGGDDGTTTVRIETSGSDVTVGGDVDDADVERTESGISVDTFGSDIEVDASGMDISVSTGGGASTEISVSGDGISVESGDVSVSTTGGIEVGGDVSTGLGDGDDDACSFCGADLSDHDGAKCRSCGWPTGW